MKKIVHLKCVHCFNIKSYFYGFLNVVLRIDREEVINYKNLNSLKYYFQIKKTIMCTTRINEFFQF